MTIATLLHQTPANSLPNWPSKTGVRNINQGHATDASFKTTPLPEPAKVATEALRPDRGAMLLRSGVVPLHTIACEQLHATWRGLGAGEGSDREGAAPLDLGRHCGEGKPGIGKLIQVGEVLDDGDVGLQQNRMHRPLARTFGGVDV